MADPREIEIFDAVTALFVGTPARLAVPVLCEALINAINCNEPDLREIARDTALKCIMDHVDLDAPCEMRMAQ